MPKNCAEVDGRSVDEFQKVVNINFMMIFKLLNFRLKLSDSLLALIKKGK
jgi:hypothetical protein